MALLSLFLTASCGGSEEAAIYLSCSGVATDLVSRQQRQMAFLTRIGPERGMDRSLLFYNASESRFEPSACKRNFQTCSLVVQADEVTEIGLMFSNDNQVIFSKRTDINRRTGSYRETLWSPSQGDRITFEGRCTRAEAPPEAPRQF